MTLTFLLGVLGFYLLIRGADLFIDSASSLGKRFHVSDIAIGLLVVAFGTSMPEFAVNMVSAFGGKVDLALGNIIGSNIANILLILGASALITPLVVKRNTTYKEVPFAVLAACVITILSLDATFAYPEAQEVLGRGDGLVLIFFFILFLYYIASIARSSHEQPEGLEDIENHTHEPLNKIIGYMIGGLTGLVLGGIWIVNAAVALASWFGVSEGVIGLTIVAFGTSLPELAASVAAARKGKTDIVIGNIVGSNIFNTFWILGATALVTPIPIASDAAYSFGVSLIATLVVFAGLMLGRRHSLSRMTGVFLLAGYLLYLATLTLM